MRSRRSAPADTSSPPPIPWSATETAFYTPLVSDWRNFGAWSEDGAKTATERARTSGGKTLAAFQPPPMDPGVHEALSAFVDRRRREGGAAPVS